MRKYSEFATPFWRSASKSLPRKYRSQLKSAESFELLLDAAGDFLKSVSQALSPTPRRSH
jgi:hypothetical protein